MGKVKIFYIDSQKGYAQDFLSYLIDNEYEVKYIDSIKDALLEYSFHKPDLIISDIKLRDGDGLHLIKKIKQKNKKIKTIILASEVGQATLIDAISLKIDKFLFKDQSFSSITKEINNLHISKEDEITDDEPLLFDIGENFLYENETYRIINGTDIIQLTTQENSLIMKLIKANGKFVPSDTLQNIIGKSGEATIDTLRTVIRKIRKKTYNDIIQNKSGLGYKINIQKDIDLQSNFNLSLDINIDAKILILKGNKNKNDILGYQLRKFGFKCESAYTISQAEILLNVESYDYIISELNLPDGDGIDFIRDIKSLNETKVIILSSNTDVHYKEYLYFKGILDYITETSDVRYLAYSIYKTILKVETNTRFNNVLVIEQSKRICEQIKDLLLPRNYKVNILNDLSQAYDVLKTKNYNLVILDIEYPQCFDFLSDVKSNIDKSLTFIILTDTHRTYETVREAYKNGASECLRKPIYAEEFILKVDQLIEHSRLIYEMIEQNKLLSSYKEVVDNSTIVSKTDKNGIITYANNMFCTISGYSKDELIGKTHNIVKHPDTPKKTFTDMWNKIKKEKKLWSGIIKNRKKDGSDYIVQTFIIPIIDCDDNIIEFISLRNDITNIYKV